MAKTSAAKQDIHPDLQIWKERHFAEYRIIVQALIKAGRVSGPEEALALLNRLTVEHEHALNTGNVAAADFNGRHYSPIYKKLCSFVDPDRRDVVYAARVFGSWLHNVFLLLGNGKLPSYTAIQTAILEEQKVQYSLFAEGQLRLFKNVIPYAQMITKSNRVEFGHLYRIDELYRALSKELDGNTWWESYSDLSIEQQKPRGDKQPAH